MFDLTGKVAIATGTGSSPIGRAAAIVLGDRGASLVVSDLDESSAHETASLIESRGGRAIDVPCDVRNAEDIEALVALGETAFGGVDIVLGNAGILRSVPLDEMTVEIFREHLEVNLTSNFVLAKAAAPRLRRRGGGAIVFTASIAGFRGRRESSAYGASKAGLVNLTRALADELAADHIRVNCICPGWVDTPMNASSLADQGTRERLLERIPQRRLGAAEEIAPAVLFLASQESGYITGEALVVDGGMLAT